MTRQHRRRPVDWFDRSLYILVAASFLLGTFGFLRHMGFSAGNLPDAAYRSAQMFFLNFEQPEIHGRPAPVNPEQHIARIGALAAAIWTIVKAVFPQARRQLRLVRRRICHHHAVILGYGPVGQAIGSALWKDRGDIRRVTAVHAAITPELALRARMDGVLLVEGDPSDPDVLSLVMADKARRLFISDEDDLRAIDTAVAAARAAPGRDIRTILTDGTVASQMAEAALTGYLGSPGLRWYSVADETARLLVADARFDRVAVELGQARMHLVLVGCGRQGEAVMTEALLTGWRVKLGPPRLTVIDRNAAAAEASLKKRFPAWFLRPDGEALPRESRPSFRFLASDVDTLDFARAPCLEELRTGVTAWVFATGDDALNLRASLALHQAMAARQLDPAPIYVRIPTGQSESAPELSGRPLTLARTFGAIGDVVARSPMLEPDPDALPRLLHEAYEDVRCKTFDVTKRDTWSDLPETKRIANRALFRHAAMKIEDFGAEAQPTLYGVPIVDAALATRIERLDGMLDYGAINDRTGPDAWLRPGESLVDGDAELLVTLRDAAQCEHNRWMTDRALTLHVPTARPDRRERDDKRRLHNNMHEWSTLDATTRRYDIVMLRALFSRSGDPQETTARRAKVRTLILPVLADGRPGDLEILEGGPPRNADLTELRIHLCVSAEPKDPSKLLGPLLERLGPHLGAVDAPTGPRRVRFDFTRPPGDQTLTLANALADEIRERWNGRIAVDALWAWRAAPGKTIGFVGHRDLTRFGGETGLFPRLRQAFATIGVVRGAEALVTGYAPGADQVAVAAWNSLGLAMPTLIFPFQSTDTEQKPVWRTDEPTRKEPGNSFAAKALTGLGLPRLPVGGQGHLAQADDILSGCSYLVAVSTGGPAGKPAGTAHSVARAAELGLNREIIGPDPV